MGSKTVNLPSQFLLAAVKDIFSAAGVPDRDAHLIADHLVRADLRGVASHGVTRVGIYIDRLEKGLVTRKSRAYIVRETPISCLMDGNNGSGIVVADQAMTMAINKATESGIGAVGVRGSNHCGMLAYYTQSAVSRGLISLAFANAPANMAPWGGRERFFGTNPVSYGIPGGKEIDIVFDMAASQVSRGKIILAAKEGRRIPLGWAINADGRDTTDPHEGLDGLALPLGGAKGSGIAFLVEVLSALLTGADFGPHLAPLYDNDHRYQNAGHFFLAFRPDLFLSHEEFDTRVSQMIQEIRRVRVAHGAERVYLPGEMELAEENRRQRDGIPISTDVLSELTELAYRMGTPSAADIRAYSNA